ncbi:Uncharacterised protein [Vibrio cholerae]|nr:Uncharacterised protein [Vibrio cholerae]
MQPGSSSTSSVDDPRAVFIGLDKLGKTMEECTSSITQTSTRSSSGRKPK